jgi:hypothetical protein
MFHRVLGLETNFVKSRLETSSSKPSSSPLISSGGTTEEVSVGYILGSTLLVLLLLGLGLFGGYKFLKDFKRKSLLRNATRSREGILDEWRQVPSMDDVEEGAVNVEERSSHER